MSGEVNFWHGCGTGKRMYASRKEAKKARGQIRHKKATVGRDAQGLSAYRCDLCRHWHLGHLPYHVRRGLGGRSD